MAVPTSPSNTSVTVHCVRWLSKMISATWWWPADQVCSPSHRYVNAAIPIEPTSTFDAQSCLIDALKKRKLY